MLNIHDFYSPLSTKEILAAIPEELKALKQYVIWDWEPRPDGKKPRKRIVKCTAKTLAASNQPQDWSTLDYALKQLETSLSGTGLKIEPVELKPQKGDIEVSDVSLVWLPMRISGTGAAEPVYLATDK